MEKRAKVILTNCRKAGQLLPQDRDLVNMVHQCAVFQTCAALETYLKLLIESWAQEIRVRALHAHLPANTRGFLAAKRFERHFSKYVFAGEEVALSSAIATEHKNWPVLDENSILPHYFNGSILHAETAYPTLKNIKRLFARVGLDTIEHSLARLLRRDVDAMIEGFQSIRTALAHSAPPDVTLKDVRRLLEDIRALVGAIDRTFFSHVLRHGGLVCWSVPTS
ncbi:hypothetical protein HFN80_19975 [Rhizobium laguerreae]|uniref:hypothetical protein n=1 Tax=Rhizobium laguerreae TaxID=1076926 RepID=UPI001C90E53E|nr:hypothetical protein [Rhizobium laguerreae]MBY3466241.1 hypothetical protein [Rhizobium laguerreae]